MVDKVLRSNPLLTNPLVTPSPASTSIFCPSNSSKEEVGMEPLGLIAGPPFVPSSISLFAFFSCMLERLSRVILIEVDKPKYCCSTKFGHLYGALRAHFAWIVVNPSKVDTTW